MNPILMMMLWACTQPEQAPFSNVAQGEPSSDSPSSPETIAEDSGQANEPSESQPENDGPIDNSLCSGRAVGTEVGNCAVNFELYDKNQQLVRLHQFAGDVIFLDLSSYT